MSNVSPKEMLKRTKAMADNIKKADKLEIAVGLPKGEATSKIYKSGKTVVEVGYTHEYGTGSTPQRSFLRVPFTKEASKIDKALALSFKKIFETGANAVRQLEKVGALLQNISKAAFSNGGYGTWKQLSPKTIEAKGSSAILIDEGTLIGSITYEVRNAS